MKGYFNSFEHKCPCCGYEVECDGKTYGVYIKGDEPFVVISSGNIIATFATDKPVEDWVHKERAFLLGCPKCKSVSFQFNN